jgi:pimeloyl-ACP methyl ester carboxylesterase
MLCWRMRSSHFIRVALAAVATFAFAATARAQPLAPVAGASNFTLFVRGLPVGSEQVAVTFDADGWTIVSSGRISAGAVNRRLQVRYTADWQPVEFTFDGTDQGRLQTIRTLVSGSTASSEVFAAGEQTQKAETIDAGALIVLPNTFFGPYEALAARLKTAPAGSDIPMYAVPVTRFTVHVGDSTPELIETTARTIVARRTHVTLQFPGTPLDADIWTDETGRLIRLSVPAQSVEIAREDVAAVSSRRVTISRPNDESVKIPANGFMIVGTLSKPSAAPTGPRPAVVLTGGSGSGDRDEVIGGIPILGQIAGALADAGFIVVRCDTRGIGQSGGRAESATLVDYAEDLRAAVRFLGSRKDVDPKRIAVVGHSEGGSIALIAASKDKRIAAVGLIAVPGMNGADVVLAQQQRVLNRSTLSADEKQAKVDAQKRINEAVITGKGLDQLSADVRRAVDSMYYQSLLATDPAKVMPDVRQPILIVQGELDTQVEPINADRLQALALARKKAGPADVVKVTGVNHLLVKATTGEVDEYGSLQDRQVSATVTQALVTWLQKTLITPR